MGKEGFRRGAVQVRTLFVGISIDGGLEEVACLQGLGLDVPGPVEEAFWDFNKDCMIMFKINKYIIVKYKISHKFQIN